MCTIFFPAVAPFGAPTLVENTEYSDRLNILVGQFFYNYGQLGYVNALSLISRGREGERERLAH